MLEIDTHGMTYLGYKVFLDRYALKDTDRATLSAGDLVLLRAEDGSTKALGVITQLTDKLANLSTEDGEEVNSVPIRQLDKPLELDPAQMWERVAGFVGGESFQEDFKWLLSDWRFVPGGRILSGAGAPGELTFYNCYVIPSPRDSKEGIFDTLNQMAQIMSRGGGVGINVSTLRPRYASTKRTNGRSSGAVSWGEVYSFVTGLIEQGGSRRGALMLILSDWHPDILEFIQAKKDMGRITNANISVGVSDQFMEAVMEDRDWALRFPDTTHPDYDRDWTGDLGQWIAAKGPEAVLAYKTVKARELWDLIIQSAWSSAEPGVWFQDRTNQLSNSWYYDPLICTNPCGEQSLPAWGVCNLGAINLAQFYDDVNHAVLWWELDHAIKLAVRFLDRIIDLTPYLYGQNRTQQMKERRVGLGTMGLAELLIRLGIRYGSQESLDFIDELYKFIAVQAYLASVELAGESGPFPAYDKDKYLESSFIQALPDDIMSRIYDGGIRNVTLLTQAPTGSTGTMVNTSTGIEPYYAWEYTRKGRLGAHTERVKVYEEWASTQDFSGPGKPGMPDYFVTAQDLTPEEHVRVQAAIQRWVDSSISKTSNLPASYTVEQTKELYELMYKLGCKGGTVYRDKSRDIQVLNLEPDTTPRKRPMTVDGRTYRKTTPVGTAYITINGNGQPFELFINVGKAGSDVAADAEGLGRLISLMLRMPGPKSPKERAADIVAQLSGIGSGRSVGFGSHRVMSLADAVAQAIGEHIGLEAGDELPGLPEETVPHADHADFCPSCGNATLQRIEGCKKCVSCGHSEC